MNNKASFPLKAILLDDEPLANEAMQALLKFSCPQVDIAEICLNTDKASEAIIRHKPDVLFLDISMPGESGIEFLKRLGNFDFEVVFVSAYDEYALDAFRLSAVDYVLKPIAQNAVAAAVEKVAERRQQKREIERYRLLFDLIQGHTGHMMLPGKNGLHEVVRIPDIVYCKADGHSTQFFLADGRRLVTGSNLGEYKSALSRLEFLPSHRSFMVNMVMISGYNAADETLLMKNGHSVDVSREFKRGVLEWLKGGG